MHRIRTLTLMAGLMFLVGAAACSGPDPMDTLPPGYSATDPTVEEILAQISRENVAAILKKLESFETRHTLSETESDVRGIGAARRWIREEYASYSDRLEVELVPFVIDEDSPGRLPAGTELMDVVAVLPGTDPELSGRHIILTGHYDTVNLDPVREGDPYERRDPDRPAPGVDDDATGVAAAMELARVFSGYEFPKSLIFMAVAGEEEGLVGARLFAQKARSEGMEIEAVLNMDMIGNAERGGGAETTPGTVRLFSEGPQDSESRQIARYVETVGERYVPGMDVDLIFRRDRFGRGGDHTAFNAEGFPGVRLVEANEDYEHQHSYNDVFENVDMGLVMDTARIAGACAATLALAPSAPAPLRLGRGEGYDAQLLFRPAQGPEVQGYVVALRSTTAPRWERYLWFDEAERIERRGEAYMQITLPNQDIDDVVIGIGALGAEGRPSIIRAFKR
ncbi:MAG: M20/M25/M40 family metallo-hydrolase [bacterium]